MSDMRSLALSRAYELVEAGKSDEARTLLEPILLNAPNNADAWWIYAHAVDDPVDARRALNKVLQIDPDYTGAADLLETLEGEYPDGEVTSVVDEAMMAGTLEDDPDFINDEPYEEKSAYIPSKSPVVEAESRSWLPVAIVAAILVLLFIVLVLILPSLSGTDTSEPTVPAVAGDTTPQATTPMIIDSTAETVVTIEVILPVETLVIAETPVAELVLATPSATASTDLPPTPVEEVVLPTVESTIQLPTDEPTEAAAPTDIGAESQSVATTDEAEVVEATEAVVATVVTETDVDYAEYLTEALQSFAVTEEPIEVAETVFGETILANICTTEGPELRETLRSVMAVLAAEADVVPEEFRAVGVRLVDCNSSRTLRIISVGQESVSGYTSGSLSETEFEAQWRAQ